MTSRLHAIAGAAAILLIGVFWYLALSSEFLGGHAEVLQARTAILWLMPVLIALVVVANISGKRLGEAGHPLVAAKKKRVKLVAANGAVILVPAVVLLWYWADTGRFDVWFYAVQILELMAGAGNVVLLSLNLRDGLRLAARKA